MAYKPTPEEIRALTQLHNAEPVKTLLNNWKATATDIALRATEPADIYRMQGRVAVLNELLEQIRLAPELNKR
jgi:hypothetical protein